MVVSTMNEKKQPPPSVDIIKDDDTTVPLIAMTTKMEQHHTMNKTCVDTTPFNNNANNSYVGRQAYANTNMNLPLLYTAVIFAVTFDRYTEHDND